MRIRAEAKMMLGRYEKAVKMLKGDVKGGHP